MLGRLRRLLPVRGGPRRGRSLTVATFAPLLVILAAAAVLSTAVYVADVRGRYDGRAPFDDAALGPQVARWHGLGTTATGGGEHRPGLVTYAFRRPLALDDGPRSGPEQQRLFTLSEVGCQLHGAGGDGAAAAAAGPTLLLFFIHGNSGGSSQGDYWGCAAAVQAALAAGGPRRHSVRGYAFGLAEQANVHRGRLVGLQADYVADAVEAELRRHKGAAVWLVGHSMGGLVARTAAALVAVEGVLTVNAPHRYPPAMLDRPMRDLYVALNRLSMAGDWGESLSPSPCTSAVLVSECGPSWLSARPSCRRRFAPLPVLLSLTSGEMDLQIEPATAYPPSGPAAAAAGCYFANVQSAAVCGRSASHNGALRDPCVVAYAAAALLNLSAAVGAGRLAPVGAVAVTVSGGAVPLAAAHVSLTEPPLLAALGRRLWRGHHWPCAAAALLAALLLAGPARLLSVSGADAALPLGAPAMAKSRARAVAPLAATLAAAGADPVAAAAALFAVVNGAALVGVSARAVVAAAGPAAPSLSPWVWDRWQPDASGPFSFTSSVGHGCREVALGGVAACAGLCAAAVATRLQSALPVAAPLCCRAAERGVVWAVLVASAYAAAVLLSVPLTWRAVVWACVAVAAGCCRPTSSQASRDGRREAAAPTPLFALVHLLQLQPALTIHNEIVSRTTDTAATVDGLYYATELCLVALLAAPACASLPGPMASPGRRFGALAAAACVACCCGCALLAASPVDLSSASIALLLSFPSFLYAATAARQH